MLTLEVIVDAVVKECARPEVNKSDVARLGINKNVLILDVTMHNAGIVKCYRCPHDLSEQAASLVLVQRPTLGDMIKQVFDALWPLHHHYETV